MAIRRPVVSVPEGGNPTLGLEQMPTGDTVDPAVLPPPVIPAHDTTGPTGTGPQFEHYNTAERAIVDAEVAASALHRVDTANPHAVTAAQAGAAPAAHVGAGGVAEHPVFIAGTEGFVPDPVAGTGRFLRDDGVWAVPAGSSIQLVWKFDTSTTIGDPGSNDFRMNSATPASVTKLAISDITESGGDASTILDNLTAGSAINIQETGDATRFIICDVVTVTDQGGWFEIDVTIADSGVLFNGGNDCGFLLIFASGTGGGTLSVVSTVIGSGDISITALAFTDVAGAISPSFTPFAGEVVWLVGIISLNSPAGGDKIRLRVQHDNSGGFVTLGGAFYTETERDDHSANFSVPVLMPANVATQWKLQAEVDAGTGIVKADSAGIELVIGVARIS